MIEFGYQEKKGNFIGTAVHLPTNYLAKHSAQSPEKALAICFRDLIESTADKRWLCAKVEGDEVLKIDLSGILSFSCSGLTAIALEDLLDSLKVIWNSLHLFNYENEGYIAYGFVDSIDLEPLLQRLLTIDEIVELKGV